MSRVALLQMTSSDDPSANLASARSMIADAAAGGAEFVLSPEVTNCVSMSRTRQRTVLKPEADDPTLAGLCDAAARHGVWLLIGSLALATDDPAGRFANRSFLVGPDGAVRARYDKIHMFDVDIGGAESYRESTGYRPGEAAVLADTPFGRVGMTICYDLRFPALYRSLAQQGATILTVPSAFSPATGAAHWEVLLRARAIENGAHVLAPAQTGRHPAGRGRSRQTWGHSMAVAPWGEVLVDAGTAPGVVYTEIDPVLADLARSRIPALGHDRPVGGP